LFLNAQRCLVSLSSKIRVRLNRLQDQQVLPATIVIAVFFGCTADKPRIVFRDRRHEFGKTAFFWAVFEMFDGALLSEFRYLCQLTRYQEFSTPVVSTR
jgi:hypothetical protein